MMSDLVSVVIVAHNNWPDLELSIESALWQTHKNLEVIVVDNSSSDATAEEVPRKFGGKVIYVRQANVGEGGGRNFGFRFAHGEFVQFLDGDDFLAPDKIAKQVEAFDSSPEADIVYGDVRQFQSCAGPAQWVDWDMREFDDILAAMIDAGGLGLMPHSVLFRRRVLEKVGPWDENLYFCDQDYWLRTAASGFCFRYCPGSLCFYRRRPGQISANQSAIRLAQEAIQAKALEYILREPHRSKLVRRLAELRFFNALMLGESKKREAKAKLKLARQMDRVAVPRAAYVIGLFVIWLPRGRNLVRLPWLRSLRRKLARLLGLEPL